MPTKPAHKLLNHGPFANTFQHNALHIVGEHATCAQTCIYMLGEENWQESSHACTCPNKFRGKKTSILQWIL